MSTAIPIACNLEALTREERARRAHLASRLTHLATRIDEREDGYALRFDFDPATATEALEWLVVRAGRQATWSARRR